MNDARRRQVAMIKAEIFATMKRLELIEVSESYAHSNNAVHPDPFPLERLRDAVESLGYAINGLCQITEY